VTRTLISPAPPPLLRMLNGNKNLHLSLRPSFQPARGAPGVCKRLSETSAVDDKRVGHHRRGPKGVPSHCNTVLFGPCFAREKVERGHETDDIQRSLRATPPGACRSTTPRHLIKIPVSRYSVRPALPQPDGFRFPLMLLWPGHPFLKTLDIQGLLFSPSVSYCGPTDEQDGEEGRDGKG